ncbi:MAG: hypothetical protein WCW56_00735 [Candidatus Paceibacterota bacterium]|jgi:hypothetical protein
MGNIKIEQFLFTLLILVVAWPVGAYVAGSDNYRIQADSVNFGGQLSSSANYKMEDTLGEIGTGTSSEAVNIHAGYQAMNDDVYISITSPSDVTLSPEINPTVGGTANGQVVWNVATNNPAGYSMTVAADASPALRSTSDSFADLAVAVAGTPDFTWTSLTNQANFGYTVEGSDLSSTFLDNGTACGVGALDTSNSCWLGLKTTAQTIGTKSSSNHPAGSDTTIKFRAQTDVGRNLTAGSYQTAINVVVTTL